MISETAKTDFWTTGGETLTTGVFHLWRYTFPSAFADAARAATTILGPHEQAEASRYVYPEDGAHFILRRVFLRNVLAFYLGIGPQEVTLQFGPKGKPYIPSLSLEFSQTRTRLQTLIIVTKGLSVGIDAEPVARLGDLEMLNRFVLAPAEIAWVTSGNEAEHARRFLRLWCRKEACLKAFGIGLQDDLERLSVLSDQVSVGTIGTAYLQDLLLDPLHEVALATTRPCAPLVLVRSERGPRF